MKFGRQLRPETEISWVVSYGGKIIPRWRTAAILKIDISPYLLSQRKIIQFRWNFVHSSRFWTRWTSRDQKWKSYIGQTPSSTERISCFNSNGVDFNTAHHVKILCAWHKLTSNSPVRGFTVYSIIGFTSEGLDRLHLWGSRVVKKIEQTHRKFISSPQSKNPWSRQQCCHPVNSTR